MKTSIFSPQKVKAPQGIILYEGPSRITGKKVVAIATGFSHDSKNPKTGKNMIQVWIIPASMSPLSAYARGKDRTTCGNCPMSSPKNGGNGTCYVHCFQAPHNIWKTYKTGKYERCTTANIMYFDNAVIRLGSYGDPAAIPIQVFDALAKRAKSMVGYTHQWNNSFCDKGIKNYCMASVDTPKGKILAEKKGWRTFRIMIPGDEVEKNEFLCPASEEAGHKTTCEKCLSCCGISKNMKSIGIFAHGRKWKVDRFIKHISKVRQLQKNKKKWSHLVPERI